MSVAREPNRRSIFRGVRRYVVCGRRAPLASGAHPRAAARRPCRAGLVPGATLLLIVLFSAFVLGRPLGYPDDPQRHMPIAGVAHYSFADFVQASR